jgi:hypothetical protein
MESMRQADLKNWSLDQVQFADLCSSLNQFFTQTGLIHSQSNVQQNVCHGAMHPTKPSQHIGTGMGIHISPIFSLILYEIHCLRQLGMLLRVTVIDLPLFIVKN